ncbi:hypothetical protein [Thiohalocapsa sp.]|uniref:hypothetical protein n=1 Tax=Thiohalocapsa sp. TaxID=2497641 RepID=UPI0025CFAF5A|nr:hypothetical protein [Thiohalocapsa sp.]
MAGRTRGREDRSPENEAPNHEAVTRREEPRIPQADPARETDDGAAEPGGEDGKKTAKPRINRGSANGAANAEEPFDIPDFFKRPLN